MLYIQHCVFPAGLKLDDFMAKNHLLFPNPLECVVSYASYLKTAYKQMHVMPNDWPPETDSKQQYTKLALIHASDYYEDLRNRMITSSLKSGKTPYQMWYGEKPNLEHVRIFGCAVYVHVPDVERKKLDKKARKLRLHRYCRKLPSLGRGETEMLRSS